MPRTRPSTPDDPQPGGSRPAPQPGRRVPLLLVALLPPLLALFAWAPSTLARDFAFDDREAIVDNPVVEGTLPARIAFQQDYWHHLGDAGHYRPLATLSLRADHAQFGTWVVGYHLKNLFLHLIVVGLASTWICASLRRPRVALLGLSVFAAHPALADSVAWVSGRTSMLGAIGPLFGALALAVAWRLETRSAAWALAALGAGLGLAAGLLGKEEAIVFGPALVLLAAARGRAFALASAGGGLLGLVGVLALRAQALGSALPSAPFAPLAGQPWELRLQHAGRALLEAVRLIAWPLQHPPNYRAADGFHADAPLWAWAGLVLYVALGVVALVVLRRTWGRPGGAARTRAAAAWGLLLALGAWAPFLQLVPAGEVFAPRFLYLPLLFLAPTLGLCLVRLPRSAIALLLCAACAGAWVRQGVYSDREAYARAVLAHVPADTGAWNDLGLALEEQGDLAGAAAAWQRGLEQPGHHARIWSNLGRRQMVAGDLDAAETSLRRAVGGSRRNPVARCNLGALLLRREQAGAAEEAYAAATRLAPGMTAAWRGLANARLRQGHLEACAQALEQALALDPDDRLARALGDRLARARAQEPGPGPGADGPASSGSERMEPQR